MPSPQTSNNITVVRNFVGKPLHPTDSELNYVNAIMRSNGQFGNHVQDNEFDEYEKATRRSIKEKQNDSEDTESKNHLSSSEDESGHTHDKSYGQDSKPKNLMDEMTEGYSICSDSNVYHIEKFLGQGTFGLVAKCTKNKTDQVVALKVMTKEHGYSANKELEAILRLREFNTEKINVMTCFDWFMHEDNYCFTFELLDQSLFDFMERRDWSPLGVPEIRTIAKQMFVSLKALKDLGMTHTDIKIDNIMLVNHTATPFRVKLIDFGLCHLTSELSKLDLFQAQAYRAPEVYLGFSKNEAVDMWGLACTLGELHLGQVMFSGFSEYEILRSIISVLGQPDKHVLDRSYRASQYFTLDQTGPENVWRFKTAKKFQEEFGVTIHEENDTGKDLQSLDELVEMATWIDNPHEKRDLIEFVDLLKRMLAVNPEDRILPEDALNHNFITMQHLPTNSHDSYVKKALKIMSDCQPRTTEDLPLDCESPNTSHPGPTMAPPASNCSDENDRNVTDDANFKSSNLMDEMTEGYSICSDSNVYHIEKFLGQGTFGLVAKCTKNKTDQVVALKVMTKEHGYSANKELEAILRLREFNTEKINVMTCFDWFMHEGNYCFTFELLDRSLFDFMERRDWSPLGVPEIRTIAKQMFVSLKALKDLGMTHTDIKIDNIMLVNHTATPFRVKLIDFGLCHLTSELSKLDLFQAPVYRAPEVYLGFSKNEAVDMWGLACTLGELHLGQVMFSGFSEYEILRSIISVLGQPDKHVLDRSYRASQYFTLDQTGPENVWRFKTAKKFQEEFGVTIHEENNTGKDLQSLDELVEMATWIDNPHEKRDLIEFVDLLKRMLAVNPEDRILPEDALNHNFITMKHLPTNSNDSYVKKALKIMSDCQPRTTEDLPLDCESPNTSHPGPTMAPRVLDTLDDFHKDEKCVKQSFDLHLEDEAGCSCLSPRPSKNRKKKRRKKIRTQAQNSEG